MRAVVILQVRNTSTRLPGKALMRVGGIPSALLAALRAGNQGHKVLMATSIEASDDHLAKVFRDQNIEVFRGPMEDVLGRYALAAGSLPEDCVVIRLTGDNVVPDGEFVSELVSAFADSGAEYMAASSPHSRLPYGLGGEAFLVTTLRRANTAATSPYDREHVGPWMQRNCRSAVCVPRMIGDADYSHLRCTIDDEEDYVRMCRLFEGIADPVHVGCLDLAKKLAQLPGEPAFRIPYKTVSGKVHSELVLGTAQLGMAYGIVNRAGKPARSLAIKMVRNAIAHGVTSIDTARAYGDAEVILGDAFSGAWRSRVEVVTKLDPLAAMPHDAEAVAVRAAVDDSVRRSCEDLGTSQLSTLLLHRWEHRSAWDGVVWDRLLELRAAGKIGRLGASVYEPDEAITALRDPVIRHLQIPMNVLDWRWKAAGVDQVLAERPDVVVHARSALLQGLLSSPAECWPVFSAHDARRCISQLRQLADSLGRESVTDLCFAYVRSQPWITSVVVGCDTIEQLEQNLRLFRSPHLNADQATELERSLPFAPEELLNPSRWKLVHEQSPS